MLYNVISKAHGFPDAIATTADRIMLLPQTLMVPVAKNNVIVVKVDNLLVNWPTYIFDFTPDKPGPVVCFQFLFVTMY